MEALAFPGSAVEYVQVLAFRVVVSGLGGEFEVRFDDVGHVPEDGRRTLLAVFINNV